MITADEVLTSVTLYGIVHGSAIATRRAGTVLASRIKTERDKAIAAHVKNGHNARLRHCVQDTCATL